MSFLVRRIPPLPPHCSSSPYKAAQGLLSSPSRQAAGNLQLTSSSVMYVRRYVIYVRHHVMYAVRHSMQLRQTIGQGKSQQNMLQMDQ